ncbi:hypothetical protein GH714_002475 [Hevea brasiliensis]|uniref:BRCT domain-containing protein n=1 Tax=Hevea brasiliensis TaxID=3981 RepID=A0A6A6KJX3_HEVBR|nr:hypothetical protein GH714_002475 [Hevea brasiliensis]
MCTSPANRTTPVNTASPVCISNEYVKQSCKKRLSRSSLMREVSTLCATAREPISAPKDSRKRRDLANVRVLLSHHLDEDIIKQQRKIVDRLKVSIASSITDATHFITDKFVRTRNMLEAIASGKPVGRRVLITTSIKPSKEIVSGLVKAVCGQAVERVGRSTLKDDVVLEDLLVLSCEEDYEVCVPFLKKASALCRSREENSFYTMDEK